MLKHKRERLKMFEIWFSNVLEEAKLDRAIDCRKLQYFLLFRKKGARIEIAIKEKNCRNL